MLDKLAEAYLCVANGDSPWTILSHLLPLKLGEFIADFISGRCNKSHSLAFLPFFPSPSRWTSVRLTERLPRLAFHLTRTREDSWPARVLNL
jgi:hypothetical protein